MKKFFKSTLSILLALSIVLGSALLSDCIISAPKAEATDECNVDYGYDGKYLFEGYEKNPIGAPIIYTNNSYTLFGSQQYYICDFLSDFESELIEYTITPYNLSNNVLYKSSTTINYKSYDQIYYSIYLPKILEEEGLYSINIDFPGLSCETHGTYTSSSSQVGFYLAQSYTLSYYLNGGVSGPSSQSNCNKYTISSIVPQKRDYVFVGWSTNINATSPEYQPGDFIELTNDTTLYALWEKIPTPTKPTAPIVSISRTSVVKGNSVTLTWSNVSNATNYWISGFKGETRVMGEIDNSMSKTLTLEPGTYSFTVIAINELGETSGNWVEFTVYDSVPNAPKVSVDKKLIPKGSSVKLTWTECDNVTNYWIEGFKGETRVMGEIDNSMSKTLTLEPGTYSFTVIAINELGETSGNWIEFTVYDSIPNAPVLNVSNNLIKKGDKVNLSWNAVDNVTNYWIQGYKDGTAFVAEIDNSKSRTMILDIGYYEFVVKAINELGETNSNWVNFTVYEPQEPTYTLSYNVNGGSGAPSSQTGSTSYYISSIRPTRSGYTFLGWSTSSSATYASYSPEEYISLSGNTTLYAVWRRNTPSNDIIKITIRNNPGTRTLNYGDTVRIYADAQNLPAGAKIGWYVDDGSTISAKVSSDNTYCDITATGTGTVTLAAKAVDANGNVMTDSNGYQIADVQKINTKSNIWLKIVSFFKNLFGMNRTTVQLFKNLF